MDDTGIDHETLLGMARESIEGAPQGEWANRIRNLCYEIQITDIEETVLELVEELEEGTRRIRQFAESIM